MSSSGVAEIEMYPVPVPERSGPPAWAHEAFRADVMAYARSQQMTRFGLSVAAGLSHGVIYRWWKGGSLTLESAALLAWVCDLRMDDYVVAPDRPPT